MKLSNAQKKLYDRLTSTLAVFDKYATHEEFFDNSKGEQNTLTTAWHCNSLYDSSEKFQQREPEVWEKMRQNFYKAKNERIIIARAKTETMNALVRAGLIEIIEPAKYNGGPETVRVI